MKAALLVLAAGCVPPPSDAAPDPGEVAIARVADGDTLSAIADRLSFPGGWRALARANGLRGDRIRAGSGLRVAVDYLRAAGVDPYVQMDLERFDPPLPARPLVPCRADDSAHGRCIALAGVTACIERGEPAGVVDAIRDQPDGAADELDLPSRDLVIERGGARTSIHLPNDFDCAGELDELDAHAVDLDGDGRLELVLAASIGIRNHQEWEYSRVFVVGDAGIARLDVAQWGIGSLIEDDGRCALLATSWDDFLPHPLDGEGTYFVGRPLRYAAGELVPRGDEVVRRFRDRFQVTGDDVSRPADWLARGEWWHELGAARGPFTDAVITSVDSSDDGLAVELALRDGSRLVIDASSDSDDGPYDVLGALGRADTGMLLPELYAPADPSRWVGMHALISEPRYDDDPHPVRQLWLAP